MIKIREIVNEAFGNRSSYYVDNDGKTHDITTGHPEDVADDIIKLLSMYGVSERVGLFEVGFTDNKGVTQEITIQSNDRACAEHDVMALRDGFSFDSITEVKKGTPEVCECENCHNSFHKGFEEGANAAANDIAENPHKMFHDR